MTLKMHFASGSKDPSLPQIQIPFIAQNQLGAAAEIVALLKLYPEDKQLREYLEFVLQIFTKRQLPGYLPDPPIVDPPHKIMEKDNVTKMMAASNSAHEIGGHITTNLKESLPDGPERYMIMAPLVSKDTVNAIHSASKFGKLNYC